MESMLRPVRLDQPSSGSLASRGLLGAIGVGVQGAQRFLITFLVAHLAGRDAVGVVATAISTALLLSLLWPTATGSAASKFVARARGAGDVSQTQAVAAQLARRTMARPYCWRWPPYPCGSPWTAAASATPPAWRPWSSATPDTASPAGCSSVQGRYGIMGVAIGYLCGTLTIAGVPFVAVWRRDAQRLGALVGRLLTGVGLIVALVVVQRTLATNRWTDPAFAAVFVLCWSALMHHDVAMALRLLLRRRRAQRPWL